MKSAYSIIGLGKLGASMAAAIAKRGYEVVGVDVNERAVRKLNEGHAPVQETDLEETVAANRSRIRATMSHREAVLQSGTTFVIVPTPSDEQGAFSLQYASWAFREIGRALREKKHYHNVVLTSTVLPGSTRFGLLPILERESKKRAGSDFGLCYSPEFIALGSVMRDFLNPDFCLIGEYDERCGGALQQSYGQIMENNAPCKRMSIENAELTKISVNTYVTTKITFANMLSEICEKIPGGDIDVVTDALGADARIGVKYLKGGLGYGGPCFPRDNVALGYIARALNCRADIATATDGFNRHLPKRITDRLEGLIEPGMTAAVLGLAYKPYSHVIEESQGAAIALALAKHGLRVLAYDPLARESVEPELSGRVMIMDSLKSCLLPADLVLITTPDPEFRALIAKDFVLKEGPVTVVDFWRMLDSAKMQHPLVRYIPMGRSHDEDENKKRLIQLWAGVEERG